MKPPVTYLRPVVKHDMKRKNSPPQGATIMEKINGQTPKNGVVLDTTSNVQPI